MDFAITHVRDGAEIYLQGERDSFIRESLENEDDYGWDDEHWRYLNHYSIKLSNGTYEVIDWWTGEGYSRANNLTADEVVVVVNNLRDGVSIEFIR